MCCVLIFARSKQSHNSQITPIITCGKISVTTVLNALIFYCTARILYRPQRSADMVSTWALYPILRYCKRGLTESVWFGKCKGAANYLCMTTSSTVLEFMVTAMCMEWSINHTTLSCLQPQFCLCYTSTSEAAMLIPVIYCHELCSSLTTTSEGTTFASCTVWAFWQEPDSDINGAYSTTLKVATSEPDESTCFLSKP